MKLLVCVPKGDPSGKRLLEVLSEIAAEGFVEVYDYVPGMMQRTRLPVSHGECLLVVLAGRLDLLSAPAFLRTFGDMRLILVLPDMQAETLAAAHRLRPRFVTSADAGYAGLKEVLKRMVLNTSGVASPRTGE